MDPDEHVPYILDALRKFDLVDPQTGQGFREYGELTREAFPMAPDEATKVWHESVFLKRIKDNEERAAEAEKAKGAKPSETTIPGGGASPTAEDEGIRLDDDIEDNETMKGEHPRTSYSTRSPSPPRRRPQSRASSSGSYYRGRSRSPLPQKDTGRLHAQQHSYASGYSHYGTPEPPPDMDDRIRGQSRKNSHIQYVYEGGEARPVDEASVRSVSPSSYGGATPLRRRKISHEQNVRGRSADPYKSYYSGYQGNSRGDSVSPIPKFRSKSHGGQSGSSSTEELHQPYGHWSGPLPPYANFVYQQEVSPSRGGHMRAGHLRTVDSIPTVTMANGGVADYYQHHLVPPSAGSSTIHPLSSGGGRGTHHQRGVSPHGHGHQRARSGGRGRSTAHSGANSRYHSSTDSLIPPDGHPPVTLSKATVPTAMNVPPQKPYQSTVMSESEEDYGYYNTPNTHHHHQYVSPNPSHHRSGSGGASTTAQAGVYKRSTRNREKERDRALDSDRMMKMQQMGSGGLGLSMGGGYEEEVAVGGRGGGYRRSAAGGKGAVSSGGGSARVTYMPGVAAGGVKAGGSPYL